MSVQEHLDTSATSNRLRYKKVSGKRLRHLSQYLESLKVLRYLDSFTGEVVEFDFNPLFTVRV